MFEAFRRFVSELTGGDAHPSRFDENDYRLAAAALLVHAAAIDGTISDLEREALHAVIKRRFGLDDANTDRLLAKATEAEQEAIDLYHFTSQLNRTLDEEGRPRVVEMMWRNSMRSREDTPSRSAARQIRFSSNSSTRRAA